VSPAAAEKQQDGCCSEDHVRLIQQQSYVRRCSLQHSQAAAASNTDQEHEMYHSVWLQCMAKSEFHRDPNTLAIAKLTSPLIVDYPSACHIK
jgi:hypothetical protein